MAGPVFNSPTPPLAPEDGDLWFNTTTGREYVWYISPGTGLGAWVQTQPTSTAVVTPAPGPGPGPLVPSTGPFDVTRVPTQTMSEVPPLAPLPGDLWWNTISGQEFIYYDDGTTQQWVIANKGNGLQGDKGDPGPQGEQGIPGPMGPQGIPGPQGDVGPMGPQGIQGIPGLKGDTGDVGPQGPIGPTGPAGPQGDVGPMGPQGIQGIPGIQGPIGPTGATGPQGIQGIQGPIGPIGPTGPVGEAPLDGQIYGRQNAAWINVTGGAGGPPTGPAGGALAGTYPNPTLVGGPLSNYLTSALAATTYAPLASPVFTGNPTAPTPLVSDNDTSIATTAFVQSNLGNYLPKASPAFTGGMTGAGGITLSSGDIQIAGTAAFKWNSRSIITSSANGSILLTDSTGIAFNTLQFGNVDATAPGLRRNGSQLTVKLADNSADAVLTFATAATADNTTKGATTAFVQTNLASYLPLAGGTLTGHLRFSADNTFDVGSNAALRPRDGWFGRNLQLGSTGSFTFGTRVLLASPADRKLAITDNATAALGGVIDTTTDGTFKFFGRNGTTRAPLEAESLSLGGATVGTGQFATAGAASIGANLGVSGNLFVQHSSNVYAIVNSTDVGVGRPTLLMQKVGANVFQLSVDGSTPGLSYYEAFTATGAHQFVANGVTVASLLPAGAQLFGNPVAPTPAAADEDTSIATTAFVKTAGATATTVGPVQVASVPFVTASVFVNGPTTGAIGAAGQKWMILGNAYFDAPSQNQYFVGRIWNGSADVGGGLVTSPRDGSNFNCSFTVIVTLTGPTTFTLQGANLSVSGQGNLNGDSRITAIRLS